MGFEIVLHSILLFETISHSILCFITYFVTKVLMREVCCPKVDIGDSHVIQTTATPSETQPLLAGTSEVADGGTIMMDTPQVVRTPRMLKRQSLSELSPEQCFHAYHSRFINKPSAPSEYTIFSESES